MSGDAAYRSQRLGLKVCLAYAGAVIGLCLGAAYLKWRSIEEHQRRAAEQQRLVTGITDFQAAHGRPPESLAEAGIEPDPKVFRSVGYRREMDGSFDLSCTEAGEPLFGKPVHWIYEGKTGVWTSWAEGS